MNALQQAQALLEEAANCWQTYDNTDQNPFWRGKAEQLEERAARYAAVAQAEYLDRIASALEQQQAAKLPVYWNDK